ncbi:prohibitin family protein [Haloferax larsenii]|uniref:Regulator of protease activity HflC, stomatin/prohibitin superfamily n=1 Tax=Haloferax larsenii TaxID=302484 RepID=A0A1H7N5X8_HALLR|nr:prohibitin family protein [Haloferax larsenii]SEL18709.1 Regulator of protease activity HflC, stomatin/prohibitin superfamily [Haloferax larsenii]
MIAKHHLKFGVGLLAIAFLLMGAGCIETVEEGHVGVQKSWGAATGQAAEPGMKIDRPGISYYDYDVREQMYVAAKGSMVANDTLRDKEIEVMAADDLTVEVDAATVFRVKKDMAVDAYTQVGPNERIQSRVASKTRECIREAGHNHDSMSLASGNARAALKADAKACMEEAPVSQYVEILDVQIRNIEPPQSVKDAIERKISARQNAEAMEFELEAAKKEAERKRIEAEGIADAQKIIDETLTDEYIRYLWITEGIEKGDTVWVVPAEGGQPVFTKEMDTTNTTATGR